MTSASSGPVQVPMPMFPLGTVLFPFARLPLHVFEPRYRVLVHDCLRRSRDCGACLRIKLTVACAWQNLTTDNERFGRDRLRHEARLGTAAADR